MCPNSLAALERLAASEVGRRVAAGTLSVSAFALKCGCSQPHVSNWVRGRRRAALSLVDVALGVLRIAPCELLGCAACGRCCAAVATVAESRPPIRRRPWRRRVDPVDVDGAAA